MKIHKKALNYVHRNKHKIEIFNLGLGKGVSVLEIINIYQKINKIRIDFNIGKRREGDLPICYSDNNLAHKKLDWSPKYDLNDICRHSYLWMHKKLKKK